MASVFIVGCGYTGRRVAQRLLQRGIAVAATTRTPEGLQDLALAGAEILRFDFEEADSLESLSGAVPRGAQVLLSVPTLRRPAGILEPTPRLAPAFGGRPSRVVYLSTTGVYGATHEVNETTPVAPVTKRQRLRVEAEMAVQRGPWPSLILRPAAIYGPGRGIHAAMREGRYRLVGDGSNHVSRIHVDDLARHCEKALLSDLTGAYPVADEEPCTSREIAAFCAGLLGLAMPVSVEQEEVSETRRSDRPDRRVDGRAIRERLGITLRYRSYREGIPAALEAEQYQDDPGS